MSLSTSFRDRSIPRERTLLPSLPRDVDQQGHNAMLSCCSHHLTLQLTDQTNFLPFRKVIACFFGLALCIIISTLDSVIVATAISAAFSAGSIVSWVPSAYLLTSTSFQPLYGRFSDIFGRKAAMSIAMLVFMFRNLLAGISKTIIQLIVFRGIAGAGGGEWVRLYFCS